MQQLLNPYIAGAPVTEASMFFGRQDVFDWIERSLAGRFVDHILVIHGQRRVGKTSVLKQIPNHLSNRYIQVYLDLQGRATSSPDRFLWWMSREILRSLRGLTGVTISAPEQSAFTQDPEYFHTHFLPALTPLLQDRILLLTFDEFDILSQPETMQALGKPLTDYLSHLFELDNLNFIFSIGSSGKKLENMQAAYTEFFKTALYKKVSFLEQAECYRLITQPVIGMISYDPGAVQRTYQITSGHPYYTQLICHELFSACQKENKRRITSADVESILPDVIERGTVNLKFIWDEAADLEKWCLACLAEVNGIPDFAGLSAELNRQHVRFSEPDLNSALLHLQEKDVLRSDLSFIVHLLRAWLQANRPLGRVRQELQEINPIADRFIEIGDEYKDRGSAQEAIQSYQQALSVDPANLRAQVSLASIFLAQNNYTQAAETYARALEIDPEDVPARSGFCEAQLELGEAALSQGNSAAAIDHLRRVVEVNPDHSEVRQRLADILCRQAEQLLAQGRDEDALKAIHAAHGYAPDDEALHERYNQVCSQVKGRVLASLLERASTEWKRQNWSLAIASLEEYLEFDPEAGEVRMRLEDLRLQQHQAQLSSRKAQALGLEKAERWDEAIATWQDYLALQPEDRPQVEARLESAQRSRALAESYTQAQAAMRQKEFGRAIPILQGIIAQQPSYKDTARLLAEAIVQERARRPIWKQRWVWGALVFVILFALTAAFGRKAISYISARNLSPASPLIAADPRNTITPSSQQKPTELLEAKASLQATELLTAAPPTAIQAAEVSATPEPAWIAGFGRPILSYITATSPDFQDDFSEAKPEWQLTSYSEAQGNKTLRYADFVTDGALRLDKEPGTNLSLKSSLINAPDFALQFDIIVERGGDASPGLEFRTIDEESYELVLSVVASNLNQNWEINKRSPQGSETLMQDYSPAVRYQKPMQVLLVAQGDQIAAYFNGQPAGYIQDSTFTDGEISLDFAGGFGGGAMNRYIIDNLYFWKLPDDVALAPQPAWIESFVQPLTEQIQGKTPDFQDDFSQEQAWTNAYGLPVEKSGTVQDGALHLSAANGETAQPLPRLATDMVLQVDFQPGDLAGKDALFALNLRGDEKARHYRFEIDPKNSTYRLSKPALSTGSILAEGALPAWSPGSSASLQAFVSGSRLAFLWNDTPLASVSDSAYKGTGIAISLSVPTGNAAVDIEGVKLWVLNPIELPVWVQAFAQPLLNSIRDRPPDFEDDFSKANPAWLVYKGFMDPETGGYTGIQDYVKDGAFRLKPEFGQYHHYLQSTSIQAHDFILQFDLGIDLHGDHGRSGFQQKDIFRFYVDPQRQQCFSEGKDYPIEKVACSLGPTTEPSRFILISSGDQFGVYLDGEPLVNFTDVPEAGLNNQFWFGSDDWKIEYYFDNLKFWNLDSQ